MNFNSSVFYLIFIAAGYLLGSILFGDFLLRKWHGVSIEEDWAAFNAFCRIYTCFLLPAVLAPSSHPCTSDTQHRYVYLPAWNVCEPSCAKISGLLHEWYSAEFSVCHLRTALQTNTAIIECKTSVCFDTLAFQFSFKRYKRLRENRPQPFYGLVLRTPAYLFHRISFLNHIRKYDNGFCDKFSRSEAPAYSKTDTM